MIKLQDFAKQQGVTDRAIQKHLKTYADELEGLYERKGPNGTWLSDEACEFLRSKMKQNPVVVFEEDPRLAELEAKVEFLQKELNQANADYRRYTSETAAALAKAEERIQLAERAESLEALTADLSADKKKLEAEVSELKKSAEDERGRHQNAIKRKEEELQAEKNRKLTFKERLLGRKIGE